MTELKNRTAVITGGGGGIGRAVAGKLAEATAKSWEAILRQDAKSWGENSVKAFEAQLEMFPNMLTQEMQEAIEQYRDLAYGWKISGCGGGGYLVLISEKPIPNAIKVKPV